MRAEIYHQDRPIREIALRYAGRTNVFASEFAVPEVRVDYETLRVRVIAAQADAINFGLHERTFKLLP